MVPFGVAHSDHLWSSTCSFVHTVMSAILASDPSYEGGEQTLWSSGSMEVESLVVVAPTIVEARLGDDFAMLQNDG